MAEMTFRLIKFLFAHLHHRIVDIPACRHSQTLHIKIHILHIFGRDIQLVVKQTHHGTLSHLMLSLADLFRISAVGDTHIARKTKFNCQISVLRLVA